jgi:HK97 family phage major capsid protein
LGKPSEPLPTPRTPEKGTIMSRFDYGSGRRTNIAEQITDAELEERILELRSYDRLSQTQSATLRDYEHHLAERRRAADHARLTRALDRQGVTVRTDEDGLMRPSGDLDGPGLLPVDRGQPPAAPTPRSADDSPGGRSRDLARRTIEAAHRSQLLPDVAAERAERLVSDGPAFGQQVAARWVTATGDPDYRSAFAKKLADPENARDLWSEPEFRAWQRVMALQSEQRAMGIGAGGTGGFMVPMTLDPAILLTSDGSTNPLRRIARVVQIATDKWSGVSSAGATAEWKAENAEAADGSPTLDQPEIPVHFGDVDVPFSYEVGMDAANFLAELQVVLVDAADQLQAEAFMVGTGVGQPTGLVTALPAGSKVATAAADALTADDAVGLQNALPPRFQPRAQWLANLTTINDLGSLETTGGSLRFPEIATGRLLRKPLNEASWLDAAGDTAAAGNDNVMVYGDPTQFVIVDRVGTTLEVLPGYGANNRPTGQRHAFMYFRTGSDVVVDNAFRLLTA